MRTGLYVRAQGYTIVPAGYVVRHMSGREACELLHTTGYKITLFVVHMSN